MKFRLLLMSTVVGAMAKLLWEWHRFRSWDGLEDELETWRQSARGRFHAFLDGIESPE